MTLDTFDRSLGALIELVLPPNVSDDPATAPGEVVLILHKHIEKIVARFGLEAPNQGSA